jgi:hypothetical protein
LCLLQGWGVARNVERAWQLARSSAAAGSRYGQFALGTLYEISENEVLESRGQYQLSVAQGLDAAQYGLGFHYQFFDGDNEQALRLFRLAAAPGVDLARSMEVLINADASKLLRSFLTGDDTMDRGQRSMLRSMLEAEFMNIYNIAIELPERQTYLPGIKQTKQIDEVDGGLCKFRKTDEE